MAQRKKSGNNMRPGGNRRIENAKVEKFEWDLPCPVCGKPIRDLDTAITEKVSGNPAHFECIMKKIAEEEKIGEDEKIYYLGNGSFGIVQQRNNNNIKFFIRKRIQYEQKDKIIDWRRKLLKTEVVVNRKNFRRRK